MSETPQLRGIVEGAALDHGLDFALVAAVVAQESNWNPWAIRFEPAFWMKYVQQIRDKEKLSVTESELRACSFGLMQIMGQTARERGFKGEFLSELCDPFVGLEFGCRKLKACIGSHPDDLTQALLAWNGGSNHGYPGEVIARIPHYAVAAVQA